MPCKKCASNNERSFKSEMTLAFREHENVDRTPLYVSQDILVCLDCGHIELTLPTAKLEQLKQEALKQHKQSRSAK
ncbi:MAG TPA: hypothetical protein VNO32_15680 [Candidatus Acidoferrum sp.]|jgi:hypothetical protein|nr:hypothetical protein [Candidatus Acidoferrum sp.]